MKQKRCNFCYEYSYRNWWKSPSMELWFM